jgi:hypothetical protein
MIEKKLDIEDLQEPAKLDKFLERFTALWEIENPTSSPTAGITTLVSGQGATIGFDLLTQLQSFRTPR